MKNIVFSLLIVLISVFSLNAQSIEKGIKSLNSISYKLILYPNPVINKTFHIKSEQIIRSVEIFNVLGEKIKTINNEANIAYNIYIELNDNQHGMYMIKLLFEDKKVMIKKIFVK